MNAAEFMFAGSTWMIYPELYSKVEQSFENGIYSNTDYNTLVECSSLERRDLCRIIKNL